ncbi:flagellar protein FliS [Magnetococcus marinus MC-1]|uniref:Flagellar protein FliS n=1 Tax=Magnetococcus marinus (strain ATCC BAA-1437 / JCM 17883 / MC-1) TaxID=156889 RepID=A0L3S2_MAGMM|nr:flagellar export chaperone FliS [Magnetococcus marinus]ABK42615.1 flagellar protein FliS [Magnetococcus marinus MC-1]
MSYGLRSYKSSRANTASREDLLILLYEGAIRFLEKSLQAHTAGTLSEHKMMLQRAMAIISELQNTLDFEKGGDLAMQLFDLYNYMLDRLTKANINRDMSAISEVIEHLNVLLDGWRQAVAQVKRQGGMAALVANGGSASTDPVDTVTASKPVAPRPQQKAPGALPRLSRPQVL